MKNIIIETIKTAGLIGTFRINSTQLVFLCLFIMSRIDVLLRFTPGKCRKRLFCETAATFEIHLIFLTMEVHMKVFQHYLAFWLVTLRTL